MAAQVKLVTGPAGSGKSDALLAEYRRQLASGTIGGALWLAPARRNVVQLRARLLSEGLTACFSPQACTFGQLANQILAASGRPIRPLGRLQQREVLRNLVRQAGASGRLSYFGPIAHTPGFLELLVRFIRQLKRLEIWPEALDAAIDSPKQQELAGLYAEYQEILTKHNLYDAEGRFWSARFLLREGQTRPFDRLRHVFVDGFTDFTRTEHEVLEILAERVESLIVTLPLESQPRRRDLFAKTERTQRELEQRHAGLSVQEMPRLAMHTWPALAHLEAHVFRSPRSVPPAPAMSRVEILPAASQQAEIEIVAARIKRLLVEGDAQFQAGPVRPSQILVVLRSLQGIDELMGEVFGAFGIPVAIEGGSPLGRSGPLSALTALVQLEFEDWPYRTLLQVLGSNYFRPAWPECRGARIREAAAQLVRSLQVPVGRKEFLSQATQFVPESQATNAKANPASLGLKLLRRLAATLEALPQRATADQWGEALRRLAAEIGLFDFNDQTTGDDKTAAETSQQIAAWDAALAVLSSSERLGTWLGGAQRKLNRDEFWEFWQDVLQSEPLPENRDEVGRVRVMSATSARGLAADYLFLAGLSEQSFPALPAGQGLLSEGEVAGLIHAGLPLPTRRQHNQDEMLLFYEVLSRPSRRLILSYPALDASAQPLTPSPYVYELQQICGEAWPLAQNGPSANKGPAANKGSSAGSGPLHLSPLPAWDTPMSVRDLRLLAVAEGQQGNAAHLAELFRRDRQLAGLAGNLTAGLIVAEERHRKDQFGPFEGLMATPAARQYLAARFSASQTWSASQLEAYVSCPYEFFLNRVLRLKPLDDLQLAVDYLERGNLLHGTLAILHRRLNEQAGGPAALADYDDATLLAQATAVLDELCQPSLGNSPLRQALREIDRRLLTGLLQSYVKQHRKYDAKLADAGNFLRPAHFEVEFGRKVELADKAAAEETPAGEADPRDPLSIDAPFAFDCGEETVLLSGRIDRIDLGDAAGTPVFNIVDYKSGSARKYGANAVREGHALQLPLYTLAAAELLLAERKAAPLKAGYWFLKDSGFKDAIACGEIADRVVQPTSEWLAFRAQLAQWVLAAVRGIRAGYFPVTSIDDKCTSTCAFSTVCRINQVRVLDKVWQPPAEETP